ncbi:MULTISPECIES: hypothetical protein [Caldilinea]|jgi:hypothetical protein|uniref:hypothetical protein n=1 Tax=Caldilinea TaxID=233191 RepID=UPI0013966707|nr:MULTISPECIES: hypothetical protein [Caldilinea]MBO9391433.1 hypothetical protein [Caldilinea sp.]
MMHAIKTMHLFKRLPWVYVVGFLLVIGLAIVAPHGGNASAQGGPGAASPTIGTIPPPLLAKVTVLHAAPFDATPANTAVDVCDLNLQVVPGLNGIVYQETRTLQVEPGPKAWNVAAADGTCSNVLLSLPTLMLPPASHTLIAITGDGVNYPVESVIVTLEAGGLILYAPLIANQAEDAEPPEMAGTK